MKSIPCECFYDTLATEDRFVSPPWPEDGSRRADRVENPASVNLTLLEIGTTQNNRLQPHREATRLPRIRGH